MARTGVPLFYIAERLEFAHYITGVSGGRTNQIGVSVAGLLKIDGAEVEVKKLLSEVALARQAWHDTLPGSASSGEDDAPPLAVGTRVHDPGNRSDKC